MADNDAEHDINARDESAEPATRHDINEGAIIGAVGGAVVGALAGGPVGAVIGAVAGGAASAAAVDAVDKHDHDYSRTAEAETVAQPVASAYDSDTVATYDAQNPAPAGSAYGQHIPPVEEDFPGYEGEPYAGAKANPEVAGVYEEVRQVVIVPAANTGHDVDADDFEDAEEPQAGRNI